MTREKTIDILDDNFTVIDTHGHFSDEEVEEARKMAIKALEQKPILDTIRAEIAEFEEEVFHRTKDYSDYAIVRHCLDITNKYIAESENKKCI